MVKKIAGVRIKFIAPGERVKQPPLPPDQKRFKHHSMKLEHFAVALFGPKYHKAIDRTDVAFWKTLYVSFFEVLKASIFRSIGSVDKQHRKAIEEEVERALSMLGVAKGKDEINAAVIASLFALVFLLLGRTPYLGRGKVRELATFRTLTYCQTEEQLSWLLEQCIQRRYKEFGYEDHFDAQLAFHSWCKENKRALNDRIAFVEWVRLKHPAVYSEYA